MKNTGFILFGLAVCAAADVCAQSAQLELGVEDIAGAAVKEEKLNFGQKKQARTKTDKVTSTIGDTLDLFGDEDKAKEKKTVSLEEMKQKAAAGDIEAQLDLGYMYLYGVNGVKADYKQALSYYERAAEKKNAVALNNLGSLYFNGLGTKVDYPTAIKYLTKRQNWAATMPPSIWPLFIWARIRRQKAKPILKKYINFWNRHRRQTIRQNFCWVMPTIKAFWSAPTIKRLFC